MTSSFFFVNQETLLQRRKARSRARSRWTCTAASCCRVNANHTRLINAVRCSSSVQSDRSSANREPCVTRSSAGRWNTCSQLQHAVGGVSILVAALLERGGRQLLVNQLRISAGSGRTSRAAQLCEGQREAVTIGGREGFLGRIDGTERTDSRQLIRRNLGAKQVGNCDGRDDQDDRHDDQQLDE